ncbi:hypothetical protein MHBO_002424 [Bonamia ostreae]|uniref:Uncharacterized protein n=1 Tax=Bonamia ostreae TaxID=126728 RepID=A0ABV2AM89_9EUKA
MDEDQLSDSSENFAPLVNSRINNIPIDSPLASISTSPENDFEDNDIEKNNIEDNDIENNGIENNEQTLSQETDSVNDEYRHYDDIEWEERDVTQFCPSFRQMNPNSSSDDDKSNNSEDDDNSYNNSEDDHGSDDSYSGMDILDHEDIEEKKEKEERAKEPDFVLSLHEYKPMKEVVEEYEAEQRRKRFSRKKRHAKTESVTILNLIRRAQQHARKSRKWRELGSCCTIRDTRKVGWSRFGTTLRLHSI